ncbi:carboxylate-amine ligase [Bosea caraganae]|uniref:Putative glutamate--cysteine ligase 2 n=1 Tax=Bosea caraganae TaxID=2763117 RepID=A0A370L4G5_9HYPH|nr:carboxylate-amine ligase [Bosea caraganae]RDJ23656.1 carboxylate-amine ligase [Bosea caraganae]RDJ24472.1 carboxylate-amine ligase [Bosea caraganae]
MSHACRFGIEEEYFLSDAASRGSVRKVSPKFIAAVQEAFPEEVQREMLQSQIEVATPVCETMGEARRSLAALRTGLASLGLEHGMLLLACGTHPSAVWSRQRATDIARYDQLMRDLQMLGRRNQLCGMHIHVEVPDEDERIRLMGRIMPYLPLILALSTSSPFWQGQRTGLMGYRLSAYAELPRTGLPELFDSPAGYRAYVETLVSAGAIKDASYIWWAVRPSDKHPTLELRVADSCTRLSDTLAIAALYRCLVHHLLCNPHVNAELPAAARAIASENMWRAQRYGIHGGLISPESRSMRTVPDLLDELIDQLSGDAATLGCSDDLAACREIVAMGTSADMQLGVFEEARGRGGQAAGLAAVVDWLATETRADGVTWSREREPRLLGAA